MRQKLNKWLIPDREAEIKRFWRKKNLSLVQEHPDLSRFLFMWLLKQMIMCKKNPVPCLEPL